MIALQRERRFRKLGTFIIDTFFATTRAVSFSLSHRVHFFKFYFTSYVLPFCDEYVNYPAGIRVFAKRARFGFPLRQRAPFLAGAAMSLLGYFCQNTRAYRISLGWEEFSPTYIAP